MVRSKIAHSKTLPRFKDCQPLGVLTYNTTQGLFVRRETAVRVVFSILWEESAGYFGLLGKEVSIRYANGTKENPRACSKFRFFVDGDTWTAVYLKEARGKRSIVVATTHDVYSWVVRSEIPLEKEGILTAAEDVVFATAAPRHHLLYRSGLFTTVFFSSDLKHWRAQPDLLFTSRHDAFDSGPLTPIGSRRLPEGILVIYDASHKEGILTRLAAGAVLFAADDPKKILWRSPVSVWESLIYNEKGVVVPLGVTFKNIEEITKEGTMTLYWIASDGSIIRAEVTMPKSVVQLVTPPERRFLDRHHKNPILRARSHYEWESEAVFNPAAIYDGGRVHLLYRAIGSHGLSVLGYASSADGLRFDDRSVEPVFALPHSRSIVDIMEQHYGPAIYPSGGSWGGVEDPRLVKINDRIYLTFTAFDDWHSIRMGASSIDREDFLNKRWRWTEPVLISPAGQRHKNWVLFPEKIDGKFAILHSVTPTVQIEYVNALEDLAKEKHHIRSVDPLSMPDVSGQWDARTRGAGPPPLKTPEGWLVFYHGHEKSEPSKYKLGALLLDLHHPEKILARSPHPILAPDMWYENDGKPGVVYACGAVLHDGKVSIYYGGADRHVCVASAPLTDLLKKIKN